MKIGYLIEKVLVENVYYYMKKSAIYILNSYF